jgi:DNA repair exonuclease SbcCD nuclease subunit
LRHAHDAKPITLLHTADWQLGRSYRHFAAEDAAALSEARFEVIDTIAALCVQHAVDAVLVAGDVFDAQDIGDTALRRAFARMGAIDCPVVLLPGNHDCAIEGGIYARAQQLGVVPDNVLLALEMAPMHLCDGRVCVLPAPLSARQSSELALARWDHMPSADGAYRVGLAHGSAAGALPMAPQQHNLIDLACIESARLDYLALGDWHGALALAPRAHYSGTPEPDRFKANDAGGVLLVTLCGSALPVVQRIATAQCQWRSHSVVLDAVRGAAALTDLAEFRTNDVVQLRFSGLLGLEEMAALRLRLDALRAQVRAADITLEGVQFAPSAQELNAFMQRFESASAPGVLALLMRELVAARANAQDAAAEQLNTDALQLLIELLVGAPSAGAVANSSAAHTAC